MLRFTAVRMIVQCGKTQLRQWIWQYFADHRGNCSQHWLVSDQWKHIWSLRVASTSSKTFLWNQWSGYQALCFIWAETGAILSFFVYMGKSYNGESGSLAGQLKLVEPLLGKGDVVYIHNLYTSPDVVIELKLFGTGATGTVRSNCKNLPPNLKNVSLRKWEPAKYWSNDHRLLLFDMISRMFMSRHRLTTLVPLLFKYILQRPLNKNLWGLDLFDQLEIIAITLIGSKFLYWGHPCEWIYILCMKGLI